MSELRANPFMSKPILYHGKRLPLGELSPDEFVTFVYGALEVIAPKHGFEVHAKPDGPGDGGFDVDGVRPDGRWVCVQCKKYSGQLSIPHVVLELAKVGLRSKLKDHDVAEHYFITSGTIQTKLYDALRQTAHQVLLAAALNAAQNHEDLRKLREQTQSRGLDLAEIVRAYIENLGSHIIVWDGDTFDSQVFSVSSKLQDHIERHFTVDRILRDSPRPNFDETKYLRRWITPTLGHVSLEARAGCLPHDLLTMSPADPLSPLRHSDGAGLRPDLTQSEETKSVEEALANTASGEIVLLVGAGGAGKSTSLERVRTRLAADRQNTEGPLPILVPIAEYRGDLSKLIHQKLGITWGHWCSIPGPILLLIDGLNETSQIPELLAELEALPIWDRLGCVISLKTGALAERIQFRPISRTLELLPLTLAQIREMAKPFFHSDYELLHFVDEVRNGINSSVASILQLPFGIAYAVVVFKDMGRLPLTRVALLEKAFYGRFTRNNVLPPAALASIEYQSFKKLASAFAHQMAVVSGLRTVRREDLEYIVIETLESLHSRTGRDRIFGIQSLQDCDLLRLLQHYEVVIKGDEDEWRMPHDIVAGFLAAPLLARDWRHRLEHLKAGICDDAWPFAGAHVPLSELDDYLSTLAQVDLELAAQCAIEIGIEATTRLEPIIDHIEARGSLIDLALSARAWGILNTPTALRRLKARMEQGHPRQLASWWARRALALAGDEEFLRSLLATADEWSEPTPIFQNRENELWALVPAHVALRLARERLTQEPPSAPLGMSLTTLARHGDDSDIHFIRGVMDGYRWFPAFCHAFRCFFALAPSLAVEDIRSRIRATENPEGKFNLSELLHGQGQQIDVPWMLSFALDELGSGSQVDNDPFRQRRSTAITMLCESDIPQDLRERIVRAYPDADMRLRGQLWRLAIAHKLPEFDSLAFAAVASISNDELEEAAQFAAVREWCPADRSSFTRALVQRIQPCSELWYSSDQRPILEYLLAHGEHDVVTGVIEEQLRALLEAYHSTLMGQEPQLMVGSVNMLEGMGPVVAQQKIATYAGPLIFPAARVADRLPTRLRAELLLLHITWMGVLDPFRQLLRSVEDEELDRCLQLISNHNMLGHAMKVVLERGPTPTRLRLLEEALTHLVEHSYIDQGFIEAAKCFWSETVAQMVITCVSGASWRLGVEAVQAGALISLVAELMTPELAERLLKPALASPLSAVSCEVLLFWYEGSMWKWRRGI